MANDFSRPTALAEPMEPARAFSRVTLDSAIDELAAHKIAWSNLPVGQRAALIEEILPRLKRVAPDWVAASVVAKGIDPASPTAGEEWLAGPYVTARYFRLLAGVLRQIEAHGAPRLPGRPLARPDGQVVVPVFPSDLYDRLMYLGFRAEVWLQPGVTLASLPGSVAAAYRSPQPPAGICLVLGAGNVSSIPPLDAAYKIFVENRLVLLKMNPVNDYLTPFLVDILQPLIREGVLRIVSGGRETGEYLCHHAGIDEIHITGSDKTHDAIAFGSGTEGLARKQARQPLINKPITSELGNVSGVIIVPGRWSQADIAWQAENLASMLTNNAGFNCNATRVIITARNWPQREELLQALRHVLATHRPRQAYYPGADARCAAFMEMHPEAEQFGEAEDGQLPWVLIPNIDASQASDICFTTEAFCSLMAETALEAETTPEFLERAVDFVNHTLWGSLNAALIVHPRTLRDRQAAASVDQAIASLRVGTVGVNHWPAVSYAIGSTTWGAYPGHELWDIQSGRGVVHNAYMLDQPEKSVFYGPFRPFPKPVWFLSHRRAHLVGPRLVAFECRPALAKLPGIFWQAMRG